MSSRLYRYLDQFAPNVPRHCPDGSISYSGVVLQHGNAWERIRLHDDILVESGSGAPYIGHVVGVWHDNTSGPSVRLQWYYRSDEISPVNSTFFQRVRTGKPGSAEDKDIGLENTTKTLFIVRLRVAHPVSELDTACRSLKHVFLSSNTHHLALYVCYRHKRSSPSPSSLTRYTCRIGPMTSHWHRFWAAALSTTLVTRPWRHRFARLLTTCSRALARTAHPRASCSLPRLAWYRRARFRGRGSPRTRLRMGWPPPAHLRRASRHQRQGQGLARSARQQVGPRHAGRKPCIPTLRQRPDSPARSTEYVNSPVSNSSCSVGTRSR